MNSQGALLFEAPLSHEIEAPSDACNCQDCRQDTTMLREWEVARAKPRHPKSPFQPPRMTCPPPPEFTNAERTALAITTRFETGVPFATVVSAVDGISFGMIQWNLQAGTLQNVLKQFQAQTKRLQEFFGPDTQSVIDLINLPLRPVSKDDKRKLAVQKALDERLALRWENGLLRLSADPVFCGIIQQSVRSYIRTAVNATKLLGFKTVRGLTMMFDIAVGDGLDKNKTKIFADAISKITDEKAQLRAIAPLAAQLAFPTNPSMRDDLLRHRLEMQDDRRRRRLVIANGFGNYRSSDLNTAFPNLDDNWQSARPVTPPGPTPPPPRPPTPGTPVGPYSAVNTQLPTSGPGFVSYHPQNKERQYALPETIRALQVIGQAWRTRHPNDPPFAIGDISFQGGGFMAPHKSHQHGIDVDIRPLRNDGRTGPTTFRDSTYSRQLTQELVNLIHANGVLRVQYVFFNDSAVQGVSPQHGHDNHLHVRFFPPGGGQQPVPPVPPRPPVPPQPGPRPTLRRGSWGTTVRELQARLNAWLQSTPMVRLPQLKIDGRFGPKTQKAVLAFQHAHGLRVDGIVGPKTWKILLEQRPIPPGPPRPPQPGPTPPAGAPALIRPAETLPPGTTLFVNIDLGREGQNRPMTGIFIPENYRTRPRVDILLYLHGHKEDPDLTIDRYWKITPLRAFREKVNASGKNVILVSPTLGLRSQAGWLAERDGLDRYIDQIMAALTTYGPYRGQTPTVGNIILAAHSGGGSAMRKIINIKQRYSSHICECWAFDSFYSDDDPKDWGDWAKANTSARLYVHYWGTAKRSTRLQQRNIPNITVQQSDADHDHVPIRYWLTRLQSTGCLSNKK